MQPQAMTYAVFGGLICNIFVIGNAKPRSQHGYAAAQDLKVEPNYITASLDMRL